MQTLRIAYSEFGHGLHALGVPIPSPVLTLQRGAGNEKTRGEIAIVCTNARDPSTLAETAAAQRL
ncbi:MAG: hypothetical protein ACREAC_00810 [Blastocatellia bacterium]